jgi:hypothetical protein
MYPPPPPKKDTFCAIRFKVLVDEFGEPKIFARLTAYAKLPLPAASTLKSSSLHHTKKL